MAKAAAVSALVDRLQARAERIALERAERLLRRKRLDWRDPRLLWPEFLKGAL